MAKNYVGKRRSFIVNGNLYTRVDSTGRLPIPKIFILPNEWKIHKGYYMGDNKIYFEPDDKYPFKEITMKFNIPSQIRQLLDVKQDDIFEITHSGRGFIAEKIDDIDGIFKNAEEKDE